MVDVRLGVGAVGVGLQRRGRGTPGHCVQRLDVPTGPDLHLDPGEPLIDQAAAPRPPGRPSSAAGRPPRRPPPTGPPPRAARRAIGPRPGGGRRRRPSPGRRRPRGWSGAARPRSSSAAGRGSRSPARLASSTRAGTSRTQNVERSVGVFVVIGGVGQGRTLPPALDGAVIALGDQLHQHQRPLPVRALGRQHGPEEGELDQPEFDGDQRSALRPRYPTRLPSVRRCPISPRTAPSGGAYGSVSPPVPGSMVSARAMRPATAAAKALTSKPWRLRDLLGATGVRRPCRREPGSCGRLERFTDKGIRRAQMKVDDLAWIG